MSRGTNTINTNTIKEQSPACSPRLANIPDTLRIRKHNEMHLNGYYLPSVQDGEEEEKEERRRSEREKKKKRKMIF